MFETREGSDQQCKVSSDKKSIKVGANCRLTITDAKIVGNEHSFVQIGNDSYSVMQRSYDYLKSCVANRMPVYGVNTNFGDQVSHIDPFINNEDARLYYDSINNRQENIIKSLACGIGNIVPVNITRVAMLLRAHCVAQGYSGVNLKTVETILAFLNSGITPIVRHYGSIGASGDLIPLATITASLIGENLDVMFQGKIMKAPEAMAIAGIEKLKPELRDGLALINGTSFMTAIASLAMYDLTHLFNQMLAAIAMSLESMLVIRNNYQPNHTKCSTSNNIVNDFLLNFWQGSHLISDINQLNNSTLDTNRPNQDCYSLRAVSQGFDPFQENLTRTHIWIENEMNSINDNPIIDAIENKIHHTANFMGYYVTDTCDILKMDIAQASTWIHALLANMVHPHKNHGLPANLVVNPGKNNGFRSMQLLAAALAVQNRKLAQAHQAFHLPTEGDNQDVNSLGTHAAFDLQESVANLERLTAILLIASTQALELRGIENASVNSRRIYHIVREVSPTVENCRPMSDEIENLIYLLKANQIFA